MEPVLISGENTVCDQTTTKYNNKSKPFLLSLYISIQNYGEDKRTGAGSAVVDFVLFVV